jgi:hypothetical protein
MALALFADFIDKFDLPAPVFYGLIAVAVVLIVVFVVMRMRKKHDDD